MSATIPSPPPGAGSSTVSSPLCVLSCWVAIRGDAPTRRATDDRVDEAHGDLVALVDGALRDSLGGAAVVLADHDVLRDIGELASQVARVRGLQRGIGQSLAGAVRRGEVLEDVQSLAEVGLDRLIDDLAGRLGHQTTHAGELTNLLDGTTGLGHDHAVDRVDVVVGPHVVAQLVQHVLTDLLSSVGPGIDDLQVALALGDDASLIEFVLL